MNDLTDRQQDAQHAIAEHGRQAVAHLLGRIESLLKSGDEAGALELDAVLQLVEQHFSR